MKRVKINLNNVSDEKIDQIISAFKAGQVVAYPTDTVYGLGCLATNKSAIEKIFRMKKRDKDKPLLVLVSSIAMLKQYAYINRAQAAYLNKIWPGPVSVILKSRGILPDNLTGGEDSLAARLPKNEFLATIITRAGVPLVSTSLNISGGKRIKSMEKLSESFKIMPDWLVLADKQPEHRHSQITDIRDINNIKIIRK